MHWAFCSSTSVYTPNSPTWYRKWIVVHTPHKQTHILYLILIKGPSRVLANRRTCILLIWWRETHFLGWPNLLIWYLPRLKIYTCYCVSDLPVANLPITDDTLHMVSAPQQKVRHNSFQLGLQKHYPLSCQLAKWNRRIGRAYSNMRLSIDYNTDFIIVNCTQ